jgi:hypothetical protein
MRYLTIYTPDAKLTKRNEAGTPPSQKEITEMGKFIEDAAKAGVLLSGEGCAPTSKGARIRLADGKFTVTDGPFAEAKELIAGFAILQTKTKAEAIEWTKRFLKVAGDGVSEVRLLHEATDFPPQ